MQRWDRLNDRQADLLRRIAGGDDLSSSDAVSHRVSARALQARRLVDVSRTGGAWRAIVTEAGRFYLEHGFHPEDPSRAAVSIGVRQAARGAAGAREARAVAPDRRSESVVAPAQNLIDQLVRGDGMARVEEPDEQTRAQYRRVIHAAKQHGLVPDGHELRHTGRNSGDIVIRLYDTAHVDDTEWNRIRLNVRHQLTADDEVIAALRKDPSGLIVSQALLPRTLELVRLLAAAARARGHRLVVNTKGSRPTLSLRLEKSQRAVKIREPYDKVPHVLTDDERRRKKRNPWLVLPEHDQVPSGRLLLEVNRATHGRTDSWQDDKRATLESRIGKIVAEVEDGFLADRRQHEEQERARREELERWERQKAAERGEWEQAKAAATVQAREKLRADRFRAAFDSWAAAEAIRSFCATLEASRYREVNSDQNLAHWLAWARERANRLDPTTNPAVLVENDFDIEPKPKHLEPFMGEWSATEPRKPYRSAEMRKRYADVQRYEKTWHHGMRGNPQAWRWRG